MSAEIPSRGDIIATIPGLPSRTIVAAGLMLHSARVKFTEFTAEEYPLSEKHKAYLCAQKAGGILDKIGVERPTAINSIVDHFGETGEHEIVTATHEHSE